MFARGDLLHARELDQDEADAGDIGAFVSKRELGIALMPDYVVDEDILQGQILTTLNEYRLSIFGNRMFMLYTPKRRQTLSTHTYRIYFIENI